jgi:hypothetical protein
MEHVFEVVMVAAWLVVWLRVSGMAKKIDVMYDKGVWTREPLTEVAKNIIRMSDDSDRSLRARR